MGRRTEGTLVGVLPEECDLFCLPVYLSSLFPDAATRQLNWPSLTHANGTTVFVQVQHLTLAVTSEADIPYLSRLIYPLHPSVNRPLPKVDEPSYVLATSRSYWIWHTHPIRVVDRSHTALSEVAWRGFPPFLGRSLGICAIVGPACQPVQ